MVVVAATQSSRRLKTILKFPCRALSLNRSALRLIRCIAELVCRCSRSMTASATPPLNPLPLPPIFASSAATMVTRAVRVPAFRLLKFALQFDSIFFVPIPRVLKFSIWKSATTHPFVGKRFATF